jgi:uncharacterized phosphosugar-binding protein
MTKVAEPFFNEITKLIQKIRDSQSESILDAANLIADSLNKGGILHVFGTGHSHMMAEELFFRSGGLMQVNAILDQYLMLQETASGSMQLERMEKYADFVLARYDIRPGDIMLIVSSSGRNAGPIDAAIYAKTHGLKVIAMTSKQQYSSLKVRHSAGKHLSEYGDVVIDTCMPEGDAITSLPGLPEHICPASTILGAVIIQALVYETIKGIMSRGQKPHIFISGNVDQNQMQEVEEFMRTQIGRIRHM